MLKLQIASMLVVELPNKQPTAGYDAQERQ
jgi:hypothetical protein